ncbi:hypothetical protein [Mariniluteicoccus flavus]
MKIETLEEINDWLPQVDNLWESLMDELSLTHFGYSVRVVFTLVIDRNGRVLEEPFQVTFDLEGVQDLSLHGALTPRMLEHPERINWGLSEVARVRVTPSDDGVCFEVLWEGERRVEVTCRQATLTLPGQQP